MAVDTVRWVALEDLIAHADNPRFHDDRNIEAIADSLKRYGQVEPLVVQEGTNVVVGGNGRLRAMRELGFDKAAVTSWDLSDTDVMDLSIRLNRTSELARWDDELLSQGLEFLAEAGRTLEEIHGIGFAAEELETISVSGYERTLPGTSEDVPLEEVETPDLAETAITKPGDVWLLGPHRLVCGDSTDPEVRALAWGEHHPTLTVTDPPYGVSYEPSWRKELDPIERSTKPIANDDRGNWVEIFETDVVYSWAGSRTIVDVQLALREAGFEQHALIAWVKPSLIISRGHYHSRFELCIYSVKHGKDASWIGDRKQTNVIEARSPGLRAADAEERVGKHPTQKPIECMARPIRNHSGIVFDPFLGTGTTIMAAQQLDRVACGIELDPAYCDVIVQRWEQLTGGKAHRA